ncbi:MAG: anti-sigma factor [Candidatus Omnitrophica bacterium]|nr:anti-sigma factor [Candidatus Omnitrophota bacterium]
MMQCKKIQELLKADYLDGEVSPQEGQFIKGHLTQCPECRRLEKELQVQRMLFQGTKRKQVPERVWQNIRDAIVAERLKQEEGLSRGILERLRDLIFTPRPVFVLASSLSVVILLAVIATTFIQNKVSLSKQNAAESIVGYSLNGENGYVLYDLGTSIEEYFL